MLCASGGIKRRRRFNTFNTRLADVVIFHQLRVVVDQIVDVVTISGQTPCHPRRQAFKGPFPLLALFRVEILITIEAVQLAEIRRFVGGAIRGDKAIAVDKLPRGAALPVPCWPNCELSSLRAAPPGEIAQLLQAGDKQAGITDFIAIGHIVRARLGGLFCQSIPAPTLPWPTSTVFAHCTLYCFTSSSVAEVS